MAKYYYPDDYALTPTGYKILEFETRSGHISLIDPEAYDMLVAVPSRTHKGNCDAELVLQAMIDLDSYEKAVIVSSDGDFYCLVNYLREKNKLECVLAPCKAGCSHLLDIASKGRVAYLDNLRGKLEYKKKNPL